MADRAQFLKDYQAKHAACPQCGSTDIEQTCMGFFGDEDHNRAVCVCGWRGIVHDMVPLGVVVREVNLDNLWRITYTPDSYDPEYHDRPYSVRVLVERDNGGEWEEEVEGSVKRSGCCDWGFGQPTMIHFCGKKDAALFFHIYGEARKEFWPDEE